MQGNQLTQTNGLKRVINDISVLILRGLIVVGLSGVLAVLHLPHPTRVWERSRSRFREWVQQVGY